MKFGATLADAEKVLGEASTGPGNATEGCRYVRFASHPNVQFMVENGIVVRADAKPGLPNATGLDIGASSSGLLGKFPQAVVTGHRYVPEGHYVSLPGTGKSALVLEDDGAKITAIRGGIEPAVSFVEGCS